MICKYPFFHTRILSNGDMYVCEKSKLDISVGNLLTQDFKSSWRGLIRKNIQDTVMDGSYKLCNPTCSMLQYKKELENIVFVDNPINEFPRSIKFDVDPSCNLSCTYCRMSLNLGTKNDTPKRILTNVFNYLVTIPHDHKLRLIFDYNGEFLTSSAWIDILDNHLFFKNINQYPNVSFQLITNGLMFTQENQIKYKWLFDRTTDISVSIDAGTKADYEIVRVYGDWDLLWENLKIMDSTFSNINFTWTVVLQKDNYKHFSNLFKIANTFKKLPEIHLAKLFKTVMPESLFIDQSISDIRHPDHKMLQSILSEINYPKLKDYNDWIYD